MWLKAANDYGTGAASEECNIILVGGVKKRDFAWSKVKN